MPNGFSGGMPKGRNARMGAMPNAGGPNAEKK